MNRYLLVVAVMPALFFAGCAGFIDGVTRDTAPPRVEETTPTEEPVEAAPQEDAVNPLDEASNALVNAALELSRLSDESGLSDDVRWSTALDIWFREVDSWLRRADTNMFEHLDRGSTWTRRNRLTGILDLEQQVMALRDARGDLEEAFQRASVSPDIVVESMPEVRQAIERAGQAIDAAESAVDSLAGQLGVR